MHLPQAFTSAEAGLAPDSFEACDDFEAPAYSRRYCPPQLLGDFALLMAGHGRCVNAAMMLGDREYAMWQLACARTMGDAELAGLASRLFAYFDDTVAA
jgi:hypothetical protein